MAKYEDAHVHKMNFTQPFRIYTDYSDNLLGEGPTENQAWADAAKRIKEARK
ncbi:MAG: hypothetical protein WC736_15095 [Gallionella sp.]|jgi:hypothetical protein